MTSPYYFSSTTSTTTSIPPEPTRRPPFEVTLRPTRSTRPTLKPKNIFGNPDDSFQNPDFVPEYIDDSSAASDETDYYSYYGEYEGDYATTVEPSLGQGLTPSDLSIQLTPGPKPIKKTWLEIYLKHQMALLVFIFPSRVVPDLAMDSVNVVGILSKNRILKVVSMLLENLLPNPLRP